jgi:alpha-amylase
MKSINLIFGTYNSLPIGTSEESFELTYQKAFKPFLTILNQSPDFSFVLYYCGILLEWLDKIHPEFIMLLTEMVNRKQIEFLTGGFYEPILTLIPTADRIGQIEKLTTHLRTRMGKRPRGSWLAEKVWEPCLASTLNTSGIEYTFLDKYHFLKTGLSEDELLYAYLTEDQGKTINVFPVAYDITDVIPAEKPEKLINEILKKADKNEDRVIVLFMDGTILTPHGDPNAKTVEESWLKLFIQLAKEKSDIIKITTPAKYFKKYAAKQKIYFPSTSALDLMCWSLPSEKMERLKNIQKKLKSKKENHHFLSGGFFRQFLSKYAESNLMYSKMIYTNILVNQVKGDKYKKKAAKEELWKGQNNFAYWHGRHKGIYANRLRKEIYRNLIEAEKIIRSSSMFVPSVLSVDFDMDGHNEYLFQDTDINAYIHALGGQLFELDYNPVSWNYSDTMTRRPEVYHLEKEQIYDKYMRKSFIDHFFTEKEPLINFYSMQHNELGDFINKRYTLLGLDRERFEINLESHGNLNIDKQAIPFSLEKKYKFSNTQIDVYYTLTNNSKHPLKFQFGSELNLSFASHEAKDLQIFTIHENEKKEQGNQPSESKIMSELVLHDLYNKVAIKLEASVPASLWSFPIISAVALLPVSNTYSFDYQASCFVLRWLINLEAHGSWQVRISLNFSRI